jgi:hypothetical protein
MADQDEGAGATLTTPPEQEQEQTTAEAAAAEALARAHRPPGIEVVGDAERSGAGRRIADAAQAGRTEGDVLVADEDRDAVKRVAAGRGDADDMAVTTEWLLADEQTVNTRKLTVRLGGSDDEPVMGPWIIQAIDTNVIRAAEREAAGINRAQRRAAADGGYDELKANLRVVAEGTVVPDLKQLARQKGLADPVILLRQRFQFRVGVITAIAAEVMALSGFDQDDVRAAGES